MSPEEAAGPRCERCLETIAPGSRFCSQCGAPVSSHPVERRQLTVLFFDLVGYTDLAHRLDPEEVQRIMRAFDARCAEVLRRRGGHIARYAGDGSLAYFGYPEAREDDAEQAVRAGLELVRAVAALETGLSPGIRTRVGVATGQVVVGDLYREGSAHELTAHGEALPLAARLQTLADPGAVVIADATRRLVGGRFECHSLGARELRGFSEPVPIWSVLGPSGAEGRFAARGARMAPLLGRQRELEVLREDFAAAAAGVCRTLAVVGEAGIGKSRLVAALRASIEGEARILYHQCSAEAQESAFHPLLEQIARETRIEQEDDPAAKRGLLERHVETVGLDPRRFGAVLAAMLSVGGEEGGPIALDRLRGDFIQLVVQRVLAAAEAGPVALIFEDAHWMDSSTAELVRELCARSAEARVLLVLTARTPIGPPLGIEAEVVTLGRLSRAECETLAGTVAADAPLDPAVLASVLDRADGVPLFVEELTRSAIDVDDLDAATRGVPLTLRDSLVARLDRLAVARGLVRTAAALGRAFSRELLAAVAPLDEDALRRSLDELERSGIVQRDADLDASSYAFRHALLRDAAYDLILHEERVRLHARIANALETRFPERVRLRPEEVAHHLSEAHQWPRSIEAWLRAGTRAASLSSFAEAIAHFRRGRHQLDRLPAGPERDAFDLRLLIGLGEAHAGAEGFASKAAGESYAQALERARRGGAPDQLLRSFSGLFGFYSMGGRIAEAREVAERFQESSHQTGRVADRMVGHRLLGVIALVAGELEEARTELEAALALYERLDTEERAAAMINAQDQKSTSMAYLALVHAARGDPASARAASELGIAHSERLGHLHSLGYSLTFATGTAALLHTPVEAYEPLARRAMDFASRRQFPNWRMARVFFGYAQVLGGAPEEGLAEMREGMSSYGATGGVIFAPLGLELLARAQLRAGRPEEGLDTFERALEVGRRTGERWELGEVLCGKAEALVALGRLDEAARCFEEALRESRAIGARLFELRAALGRAELARAGGDAAGARALLEPVVGALAPVEPFPELGRARALLGGGGGGR